SRPRPQVAGVGGALLGARAGPEPLVEIYSRGYTSGMYGGRAGRDYVTRSQPDNRGTAIGTVVGFEGGELLIESEVGVIPGDGLGFEAPEALGGPTVGFTVTAVRELAGNPRRQAVRTHTRVAAGWRVIRTSRARLLEDARATYASLGAEVRER